MSYLHQANQNDTIAAIATGTGGAIGIIRISGAEAYPIIDQIFKGSTPSKQAANTLHFGRIYSEEKILDEVVLSLFRGPKSYTGEDVIEISCHASPYILQAILELLFKKGARMAKAGEFTLRAFLNGKMDLTRAEAVAELIAAENEKSHEIAMRQMRGEVSKTILHLRERCIRLLGLLELELDFSEEDVEFADRTELQELTSELQLQLKQLLESYRLGNALKSGIPVAIVGKPNAGKSTLLNQLLQDERAIVSEIEGTTRDTIEERWNCNGIPIRLIDTAGIRETTDTIEEIGVRKAQESIKKSALVLYVYDSAKESIQEIQERIHPILQLNTNCIIIANKSDLSDTPPPSTIELSSQVLPIVSISAKAGQGLKSLEQLTEQHILKESQASISTAFAGTRHIELLEQCLESLNQLEHDMQMGITSDFLSYHLRHALGYLGELTGSEIGHEDVLTYIFGNFCIGK